jgi:hypothetical protein
MSKLSNNDVIELCEKLYTQFEEDRDIVLKQYNDIKKMIGEQPEKLLLLSDPLVKSGDLVLKQTAQILEFYKAVKKDAPKKEDAGLSEEDLLKLNEAIRQ